MKRFGQAAVLIGLLFVPGRPAAGEWAADIVDMEWSPPRFVAVDKRSQSFVLLSRQSPLRPLETLSCATGQELGDKFKEGDLKTPEGVYFITTRKTAGLNYELYGDLAFPLNFPNPADVLRRKTGHGIWIHGRGNNALIPYETQGCVALTTADIHRMDGKLAEGLPVVIADEVRLDGPEAVRVKSEAKEVVAATEAWAKAWQNKSDAFFDLHDPEKFALTEGEPFATFRSHKERLFKALPWIKVDLYDVRALPGPDYWVTYFVQVYRSPTLVSQGVKRLYWQRGADGRFRIIGMEYDEMPVTLAEKGSKKPGRGPLADEADTATVHPDAPSEEEVQVRQLLDAQHATMEKVAQKAFHGLALKAQPTPEDQAILEVAQTGSTKPGVSPFATDAMRQAPPPPSVPVAPPVKAAEKAEPARVELAAAKDAPTAAPVAPAAVQKSGLDPKRAAEIAAVVESWRAAWERGRIEDYMAFYADGAVQGDLRGKDAIRRQKEGVWRGHEPGRVRLDVLGVAPSGEGFTVVCASDYQGKGGKASKGFKTLTLVSSGDRLLISKERWSHVRPALPAGATPVPAPAVVAAAAPPPAVSPVPAVAATKPAEKAETTRPEPPAAEPVAAKPAAPIAPVAPVAQAPVAAAVQKPAVDAGRAAEIAAMVESWRAAWERGHIDAYMAFYADGAVQGDLKGKDAIRRQKEGVWRGHEPGRVGMDVLGVAPSGEGFTVVCASDYQGKGGKTSKGFKTLTLVPSGGRLLISRERWSRTRPALPEGAIPVASSAASAAKPVEKAEAARIEQPATQAAPPSPATSAGAKDRSGEVAAMVEAWRSAWERGRAHDYAAFYADRAVQGDRKGREAILEQKSGLWREKAPKKVVLSDIRIKPSRDGFTVTCVQNYEDADGGSDRGRKTLRVAPSGGGFVIVEETWSRM